MKQEERNINAAFYIPFAYLYCVRLRSVPKVASWLLLYIVPTAFYASLDALTYLLVLFATFSLYELGYIMNDTVAVRREEQPSLRLSDNETRYFFAHKWTIIATRLLIAAACLSVLHSFTPSLFCALSLVIMCLLFALYNRWRNRYNVFLYGWLVFSRYLPFMMLEHHAWWLYALLFVSYPLLIGLERFSMPAYRWPLMRILIPNEESKTLFRAIYYTVLLCLLLPLWWWEKQDFLFLLPIGILWLYRVSRYVWSLCATTAPR